MWQQACHLPRLDVCAATLQSQSTVPQSDENTIRCTLCCVQELFKLKHYNDLDGGILEGFGRLLKFNIKIYVYPTLDTKTGAIITAENLKV